MKKTEIQPVETKPTEVKPAEVKSAEVKLGRPVTDAPKPKEFGGPSGPEPTRYGDWERNGRASDF